MLTWRTTEIFLIAELQKILHVHQLMWSSDYMGDQPIVSLV